MELQKYNRDEKLAECLIDIANDMGIPCDDKMTKRLVWYINEYESEVSAPELFELSLQYMKTINHVRDIKMNMVILMNILKPRVNKELSTKQKEGKLDVKEANGYILSLLGLNASSVDTEGLFEYFKNSYGYDPSKVVMIIKSYIVKPDKEHYYGKRDIQYFTMIVNEYYLENDNKINYSK